MSGRAISLLAFLLVLGAASPPPARGDARTAVRRPFELGKKLFNRGRFLEAVTAFKAAYAIQPHRVIEYNIALSYARAGKPVEALPWLRRYQQGATAQDPPLDPALQQVPLRVGTLVVKVGDPAAAIYVDGRLVGRVRVEIVAEPGQRAVDVRLGDRVLARRIIDVVAGKENVWEITSAERPPPERRAEPAAVPRPVRPAEPLAARRSERPLAPVPPPPRPRRVRARLHWAWFATVTALAAGAAAGAAAFSVMNRNAYDGFLEDRTNAALRRDGVRYQVTANALWGTAAGLALGAAVLSLFTRWRPTERPGAVGVLPVVGPGAFGLELSLPH
jgi:hypothetical protein